MYRMTHFLARWAASALVVAASLALTLLGRSNPPAKANLTLRDMHGKTVRLQELQGRIVVLNFWATWCGPCIEELPLLVKTAREYAGRDVLFVGASLDAAKALNNTLPAFIEEHGITFPIWTGASADDLDRLKLGPGVPATAFIDRDGQIVARVSGQIRPTELTQRLDWLLSGRKDPAPAAFVNHLESH